LSSQVYARGRYEDARSGSRTSWPPTGFVLRAARAFPHRRDSFREGEFDKAVKEFEAFLAFYPQHQIADLVQYRLAVSYYDQMKPVEQDQALTGKALAQFKKLVKDYPQSRYASDALAKIDICRGRLARRNCSSRTTTTTSRTIRRRPPAARRHPQELSTHARHPGDALPSRRGELQRSADRRGRGAVAAGRRVCLHGVGKALPPSAYRSPGDPVPHDVVDLRSDTLTLPPPPCARRWRADVGDDVWRRIRRSAPGGPGGGPSWASRRGSSWRPAPWGTRVRVVQTARDRSSFDADSHIFNYEWRARGDRARPDPSITTERGFLSPHRSPRRFGRVTSTSGDGPRLRRRTPQPPRRTLCAPEEISAVAAVPTGRGAGAPRRRAPLQRAVALSGPPRLSGRRGLGDVLRLQGLAAPSLGRLRHPRLLARARRLRKSWAAGCGRSGCWRPPASCPSSR